MRDVLVPITLWLLPMLATAACLRARDGEPGLPRPRASTVALWCTVAVPSLIQLLVPQLLPALRRDWSLIGEGEVWRLATSAIVQDGGLVGTGFNLLVLAVVALGAQEAWRPARTWATFWLGAVAANCVVGPSLDPVGAGNSMATFVVATGLAGSVLVRRPSREALLPAAAALACVAVMLVAGDPHGWAALLGLLAITRTAPAGRARPDHTT